MSELLRSSQLLSVVSFVRQTGPNRTLKYYSNTMTFPLAKKAGGGGALQKCKTSRQLIRELRKSLELNLNDNAIDVSLT